MIDPLGHNPAALPVEAQAVSGAHKVLRMVKNDRMGGYVPAWETPTSATQKIEESLSVATAPDSFSATLAYQQEQATRAQGNTPGEFGFGDIIDMVNPLQHIPIVAYIYRNVTGDEIRPISQVVGGAVFGGALGAAGGLVNVIVQKETGKDIAENAVSFALNSDVPEPEINIADAPQKRLNDAVRIAEVGDLYADMPGALLAFTDLRNSSGVVIKKADEDERNNFYTPTKRQDYPATDNLPPREPITWIAPRIKTPYDIY